MGFRSRHSTLGASAAACFSSGEITMYGTTYRLGKTDLSVSGSSPIDKIGPTPGLGWCPLTP